jgi:hypothetical protein
MASVLLSNTFHFFQLLSEEFDFAGLELLFELVQSHRIGEMRAYQLGRQIKTHIVGLKCG